MKDYSIILLVLINLFGIDAVSSSIPINLQKNYLGKLGDKTDVVFSLNNSNGHISGFYYYDKIGIEIKLIGEVINGNATIFEVDDQNVKRGKITGKLTATNFIGKWESLFSKKSFPLQLTNTPKRIPKLPPHISGDYKVTDQDKCALSIMISKNKAEYFYQFKNLKRELKGKVTFTRSLDENLVYINFHGIEWEENSGDVSDEDDDRTSPELELPTVIQGLLSDGEILVQNTGNAMNRYVKISQCDLKYIYLKKVK